LWHCHSVRRTATYHGQDSTTNEREDRRNDVHGAGPVERLPNAERNVQAQDGREKLGAADRSRDPGRRYFPTAESKRHTVIDLIDRWLATLKGRSAAAYERPSQELTLWKGAIGEYSLSRVTPALIAQSRDWLLEKNIGSKEQPRYRAPATANRYLAALSKAFTEAVREWHWMRENPVLRVSKGKESSGIVRYLSDDERECRNAAHKAEGHWARSCINEAFC
jgi:hypothetical protein